jgi:hypothetical protein
MRNSTLYKNKPITFRRSSAQILPERNRKNIGWGSNLQNVKKALRAIYISDGWTPEIKGLLKYWLETGDISVFNQEQLETIRVLVQRDQAGAEALIVAYDSDNGDYRQLFIQRIKVHVYVAMKLFFNHWKIKVKEHNLNITENDLEELNRTPIVQLKQNPKFKDLEKLIKSSDDWPAHERFYFLAKKIVHAYNNGLYSAASLRYYILEGSQGQVIISPKDSAEFITVYSSLFPELADRANRYKQQVEKTGIIYNLFGHPYQITTYNLTEKKFRDCQTWPQQSTVGEITRIAYTKMYEYTRDNKLKWDLLSDCHDSYLGQCPLFQVKDYLNKSAEFMEIELTSLVDGTKFRMQSEAQVGFNWAPLKKEYNELGLRELKW